MKSALIAGAGIVGLSVALELATRGVDVTVLERGSAMQEASWAAAGMLAVEDPENPPLLAPLARFSRSLYPKFLHHVEGLSGQRVPFRTTQTLQICDPAHTPLDAPLLSLAEAAGRVPGLGTSIRGSLLWLDEASLDPRDLCGALPLAARAAGVRVIENNPVMAVRHAQGSVTVSTPGLEFSADVLIVCCGAWSFGDWSSSYQAEPPVAFSLPRKGQMLSVRMPKHPGRPQLTTVLRSREVYLVPRGDTGPDGSMRIIIGATVEDAAFDRSIREDATAWLLAKAAALWPPVREAQLEGAWTGIRPGTLDGLPVIGPVGPGGGPVDAEDEGLPEHPRVWLATGHYRNGILLAPGTAHLLASWLLTRERPSLVDLAPFRPSRFLAANSPEHRRAPLSARI